MKNMVLVPVILPCPCARQWISMALDVCHMVPSELQLSLLYLASFPVSGLKALPCRACLGTKDGSWMVALATTWHGECHGQCMEHVCHWVVAAQLGFVVQLLVTTLGSSWLLLLSMDASEINSLGLIWMSLVGFCRSLGSNAVCGGGFTSTLSVGAAVVGTMSGAVLHLPFIFPCSMIISCSSAVI